MQSSLTIAHFSWEGLLLPVLPSCPCDVIGWVLETLVVDDCTKVKFFRQYWCTSAEFWGLRGGLLKRTAQSQCSRDRDVIKLQNCLILQFPQCLIALFVTSSRPGKCNRLSNSDRQFVTQIFYYELTSPDWLFLRQKKNKYSVYFFSSRYRLHVNTRRKRLQNQVKQYEV